MLQKGFLSLHMLLKKKSPSFPRNLALGTFGELLIMFSIKVKAASGGSGWEIFMRISS